MKSEGTRHIPDILDTLAQLSNDEVPTPPRLARAMLDILPDEVWGERDYVWLDPVCKSGVFLREIAARLLDGLSDQLPDFAERREHIYRRMLFGTSITEMTGHISRRSLYCSRDASGKHSVVRFDTEGGNLPFVPAEHEFEKGRCRVCGAPEDLERGSRRENYAYSFLHGAYPTKELADMKLDVIVGNPPYQLGASGGDSPGGFAMPLYQKFVEAAKAMAPRYVLMITPSRWFAGGRSLDEYRARMLADTRIRRLVDYPNAGECFPGNEIKGGVSYFLWDRQYDGPCEVTTIRNGHVLGETVARRLDDYDVLVRYNQGVSVLEKLWSNGPTADLALSSRVSPIQPFSIRTNFSGKASPKGLKDPVALIGNRRTTYIERQAVPRNDEWVDQWKVLLGAAYGAGEDIPHQITNRPIIAPPGSACTETYLVIDRFGSEAEAVNLAAYLSTRCVRFLISLRKNTQHLYNERFAFVPLLPMDREWTDSDLYERYGLTEEEIVFIESQVKKMPAPEASA